MLLPAVAEIRGNGIYLEQVIGARCLMFVAGGLYLLFARKQLLPARAMERQLSSVKTRCAASGKAATAKATERMSFRMSITLVLQITQAAVE